MRRFDIVFALALGVIVVAPPVLAAGARPVDPRQMERAPPVARPGPIDARIVGAWDVWIPGSVYYLADGRQVTQHYQAGAAMNRLEIASDGRYRWGAKSGRLEEVLPWHHQPGRRYFRVVHASGNEYEFYHADGDRLVVLFGGVGGHAATGSRLGGASAAAASQVPAQPAAGAGATAPAAGAKVEIKWGNTWYPGRIQRAEGGRFLVSYDGYGSNWDEWVDATRLRGGATPVPAPVPGPAPAPRPSPTAPSTGNTGNALGVEWRTASAPAPVPVPVPTSTPAPQGTSDASNPLGVEWTTAQRPATSTPTVPAPVTGTPGPGIPEAPRAPAAPPVSTVPPVAGPVAAPPATPPAPLPVAPPGERMTAHPIADRWKYIAAAFHGSDGRVDDALGVGGTLHFKDNGEYEQSLVIGGIANVIRGTWEIRGDRVTTRYAWRGQPASDVMQAHLRADGKQLTLVRQGSPTAYYTLDRIE